MTVTHDHSLLLGGGAGGIRVMNVDPRFGPRDLPVDPHQPFWSPPDAPAPSGGQHDWVHYCQCGLKGKGLQLGACCRMVVLGLSFVIVDAGTWLFSPPILLRPFRQLGAVCYPYRFGSIGRHKTPCQRLVERKI